MSIRHTLKARGGAAAVAIAAGLALTVAGCGGGEDGKAKSNASSQPSKSEKKDGGQPSAEPDTNQVLVKIKGDEGMELTINSAERDSSGFVTINGQVKNTSDENFYTTQWRGNEEELRGGGQSVGGATLVDKAGKKRYYVLRDTEGRCLCTSGFTQVDAGKEMSIFLQFPAPPESTDEVDFQMPTFPTATIKISG